MPSCKFSRNWATSRFIHTPHSVSLNPTAAQAVALRNLLIGLVLGSLLTTVGVSAKDYLGLSPQQQRMDYFRERGMQLDIENMRKQQTEDRVKSLGRNPC